MAIYISIYFFPGVLLKKSRGLPSQAHRSIFFKKRPLDVSLRPPSPPTEKRQYLKSLKVDIFSNWVGTWA